MSSPVKISVIIPNLHSPIIDQTLESVLAQEIDMPYEVIVVGQDKYNLVERFKEVQLIKTPKPVGAAEARNIGISQAQGQWLFFIDSDCIAQPGWMQALVEEFEAGWQVVGGGVTTPEEPFWLLVYNLSMFYGELASQPQRVRKFMPTLNLAVHRNVIEEVGLLNEDLPRGQDIEWTSRMTLAEYKLLFKPQASIQHIPERKNFASLREYVRKSGYYMIQVRNRYPEIFNTPSILKNPLYWRLLAPFIAGAITIKIFIQTREVRQHWRILPYIYLQKFSWCRGAWQSLTAEKKVKNE